MDYKPGSANVVADCLSRAPVDSDHEARVHLVQGETISVQEEAMPAAMQQVQEEQRKDTELERIIDFLTFKSLPKDPREASIVLNMAKKGYYVVDNILYYEVSDMPSHCCVVVPVHLRQNPR